MAASYLGKLRFRVRAYSPYALMFFQTDSNWKPEYGAFRTPPVAARHRTLVNAEGSSYPDMTGVLVNEISLRNKGIYLTWSQSQSPRELEFSPGVLDRSGWARLGAFASTPEEMAANKTKAKEAHKAAETAMAGWSLAADSDQFARIQVDVGQLVGFSTYLKEMSSDQLYPALLRAMKAARKEFLRFRSTGDVSWQDAVQSGSVYKAEGTCEMVPVQASDGFTQVEEFETEVTMYIYRDGTNYYMREKPDTAVPSPMSEAYTAAEDYQKQLQEDLAERATTGQPVVAKPRPEATKADALSADERKEMDQWWDSMESTNKGASKPPRPLDDRYEDYKSGGGGMTKEEFIAAIKAAKDQSPKGDKSFVEALADLLGLTVNKAGDVALGLGKDTSEVLKNWGPLGTAGAYAGIRATDSLTGGKSIPSWAWLAGAGVLLVALMK